MYGSTGPGKEYPTKELKHKCSCKINSRHMPYKSKVTEIRVINNHVYNKIFSYSQHTNKNSMYNKYYALTTCFDDKKIIIFCCHTFCVCSTY